jgi:hypothetical protein
MDGLDDFYFRLRQKYPILQTTDYSSSGFKHSFSPNPRDATFIVQQQPQQHNQYKQPQRPSPQGHQYQSHPKTPQQYQIAPQGQQQQPNKSQPSTPQQYRPSPQGKQYQYQSHAKTPQRYQQSPQQTSQSQQGLEDQDGDVLKVPNNSILGEFPTMKIKRDNVFNSVGGASQSFQSVEEVTYNIKPGRSSISNNLPTTNTN